MRQRLATVTLHSACPYSQSRYHNTPKIDGELDDAWETRTWRERLHCNREGNVIIPPMAFKTSLAEAAKYLSMPVKSKGKATWTKNFLAGILVCDPLVLPIKKEEVPGDWLHLNADGVRGGGRRVLRCMPRIDEWKGTVEYRILDDQITEEIFRIHLEAAGQIIGVGYFRPRQGGYWGRYTVEKLRWKD